MLKRIVETMIESFSFDKKIGKILVDMGLITEKQLEKALNRQAETLEPLGQALLKLRYISELELTKALDLQKNPSKLSEALEQKDEVSMLNYLRTLGYKKSAIVKKVEKEYNITYIDLNYVQFDNKIIDKINVNVFINNKIFPFIKNDRLSFAIHDIEQKEFIKTNCSDEDYDVYYAFEFEIVAKIAELIEKISGGNLQNTTSSLVKVMDQETVKRVIAASGQRDIDELIEHFGYDIVEIVQYRKYLLEKCRELSPDILVVGDNIGGREPLAPILLKIRLKCPNTRIIYLTGDIDFNDESRIQWLGALASVGVYDIIPEKKISIQLLQHILSSPRGEESVENLIERLKESSFGRKKNIIEIVYPDDIQMASTDAYEQLHSFTSTKSGTGKTFIVLNTAVAIATMGVNNTQGKRPRIAIIDTDVEGFNLSSLCGTLDDKKNILSSLYEVRKSMNLKTGELVVSNREKTLIVEKVRKELVTHPKFKNIDIYGGPKREYMEEDSKQLSVNSFVFILDTIMSDYDVVLVDVNSSIEYENLFPLFSMSRNMYFVMDMDYNTFLNSKKQQSYLEGIADAATFKYILNKCLPDIDDKKLIFNKESMKQLGYEFIAKVPRVDEVTMLNSLYTGEPIVMNPNVPVQTRYEIIKIANDIWPIKNFGKIEEKVLELMKSDKEEENKNAKDRGIFSNLLAKFIKK